MGALPSRGEIAYDGRAIGMLELEERVMQGMSLVPETRALFASMSIEDNLLLGGYRQVRLGNKSTPEEMERVYSLFPRLRERRTQMAGTLSGGERQMLAVGRALMATPRVMLLDEPTAGLAPKIVEEMFDALARIKASQGCSILMAEQNVAFAQHIADRCIVIESGRLIAQGPMIEMARSQALREAYLGI